MLERESSEKGKKIRIMKRTILKRLSLDETIFKQIKNQIGLTTEPGSDWHDIQALHEGIYVNQQLRDLLGIPQGEIEIIEPRDEIDTVGIGNTITIEGKNGERLEITIGGELDLDIEAGIYSCNSPIIKSAIGKKEGDNFQVRLPTGEVETFKILGISKGKF